MTKIIKIFFAIFIFSNLAVAETQISMVEVLKNVKPVKFSGSVSDVPKPIIYFLKGASTPSCGVLAEAKSSLITPILETEKGENFPFCEAINEIAGFQYKGKNYFIYKYIQKDTREDNSVQYFFLERTSNKLIGLSLLNTESPPKNKSISETIKWAKEKIGGK